MNLSGNWPQWQWESLDQALSAGPSAMSRQNTFSTSVPSINLPDDSLIRQLVMNRPDVAAARSAVLMASENMRLADAMRRPNVQAGPLYQTDDSGTQFWGVQAQVNLPVVNTGKPLVSQRFAQLRQQQITARQLEDRAVLEARAAFLRYARARQLVEQSREDFDRGISDSLKLFEDQFQAGQITLLQVFAGRSTLAQSRQSFLALLNELAMATADVTQATGLPPQQLIAIMEPNAGQRVPLLPVPGVSEEAAHQELQKP